MTYLIHEVMQCRRGKAPEVLECLKAVNEFLTGAGLIKNGKIYADFSDRTFDQRRGSVGLYSISWRSFTIGPGSR